MAQRMDKMAYAEIGHNSRVAIYIVCNFPKNNKLNSGIRIADYRESGELPANESIAGLEDDEYVMDKKWKLVLGPMGGIRQDETRSVEISFTGRTRVSPDQCMGVI